jgi:hypothetical protein
MSMTSDDTVARSRLPEGNMRQGRRSHHTAHFYLALAGLVAATGTCVLNIWAYYDEGHLLTFLGFIAAAITAVILFLTWFWGGFLAMSRPIGPRILPFLVVHAALGSVIPLVYILHVGFQITTVASQPISGLEVSLDIAGLGLMLLQVAGGIAILGGRFWSKREIGR